MARDYYEVLGVSRGASEDDIKKAFRRVAMESHPDRNPGDAAAEARFKEASEAFAVLSDSEKRRRYDRMGHSAFQNAGGGPGYERVDFSSFSEVLEGLFGDLFAGRRKGRVGAQRRKVDGMGLGQERARIDPVVPHKARRGGPVLGPVGPAQAVGGGAVHAEPFDHEGRHAPFDLVEEPHSRVIERVVEVEDPGVDHGATIGAEAACVEARG